MVARRRPESSKMVAEVVTSVADLHHFDADADPDPTFHSDADPDTTFQFDADPDPTTHYFFRF